MLLNKTNSDLRRYSEESGLLLFLNSDVNQVIPNPIIANLPISREWATPPEVDALHAELVSKLDIVEVKHLLKWKFNKRFTATYGQADFEDSSGAKIWQVQYAFKYWLLLTGSERKNLITHEMCHLAVEWHFGYDNLVNSKRVLTHGSQWKNFMDRCKEDPDMEYQELLDAERSCDFQTTLQLLNSLK